GSRLARCQCLEAQTQTKDETSGGQVKSLLIITACVALMFGSAASAAGQSHVIVTIMGAGLVKIEGHTYADVHDLGEKLAEIRQRKPPQDIQVVTSAGRTAETLLPAIELLRKAVWQKGSGSQHAGEPPKIGFLIEPRAQ